jgi:hypothetical protein
LNSLLFSFYPRLLEFSFLLRLYLQLPSHPWLAPQVLVQALVQLLLSSLLCHPQLISLLS